MQSWHKTRTVLVTAASEGKGRQCHTRSQSRKKISKAQNKMSLRTGITEIVLSNDTKCSGSSANFREITEKQQTEKELILLRQESISTDHQSNTARQKQGSPGIYKAVFSVKGYGKKKHGRTWSAQGRCT